MENIIHTIEKGDSLESIAKMYNTSVKEMIVYHNENCGITEIIRSNTLSKYQRYIYIKPTPPKKEKLFIDFSVIHKPFLYDIIFYQKLTANGSHLADTETENTWSYTILEVNESKMIIKIELISQKVKNRVVGTEELVNFCTLFNIPIESLVIELNVAGQVEKIINQQEILEKWKMLRSNVLDSYQDDESMKGIFIAADTQFTNTLITLQSSLLYFIFFDNVYQKELSENTYGDEKCSFLSNLFQGLQITFKKQQKTTCDETFFVVKNDLSFVDDTNLGLKDKYNTSFKEITGKDFSYNFSICSEATYLIDNGILQRLEITSTEKANEQLYHQIKYKVNLKAENV